MYYLFTAADRLELSEEEFIQKIEFYYDVLGYSIVKADAKVWGKNAYFVNYQNKLPC